VTSPALDGIGRVAAQAAVTARIDQMEHGGILERRDRLAQRGTRTEDADACHLDDHGSSSVIATRRRASVRATSASAAPRMAS
jgi:hypothetical protein